MKPKNILFYYGYLNSFNSAVNGWDNNKVAKDLSKYKCIVLGDGIANSGHADYANAVAIFARLKEIREDIEVFGYVSLNQSYEDFRTKVEEWENLGDIEHVIDGIFIDEAGYDFGNASTNGRVAFNQKVDLCHSKGLRCFINAWNVDHVLYTNNDPSYPNATYNPDLIESELENNDIYLFESLGVNTLSYSGNSGYEDKTNWKARVDKALAIKESGQVLIAGVSVIDEGDPNDQAFFNFSYVSALMAELDYFGSSSHNYGAGGAVSFYERMDIAELALNGMEGNIYQDETDTDIFYKYLENGRLLLDFSPLSGIEVY